MTRLERIRMLQIVAMELNGAMEAPRDCYVRHYWRWSLVSDPSPYQPEKL